MNLNFLNKRQKNDAITVQSATQPADSLLCVDELSIFNFR